MFGWRPSLVWYMNNRIHKHIHNRQRQGGLSLLEVLIAASIMATIATLAFSALQVVDRSREVSEERLTEFQQLDRAWLMLEADISNSLAYASRSSFGDTLPALTISYTEDYWLNLLRGGKANPLGVFRTELLRVAYRLDDEGVLWRDTWYDPGNVDPDLARQQKVLEGVNEVEVRVLPNTANSIAEAAWSEEWPPQGNPAILPYAIRISLDVEGRGELERMFTLQVGK